VEVLLSEVSSPALDRALAALREGLDRDIGRWAVTEAERDAVLARIRGTVGVEELSGVPVVLEAIPEDFAAKVALLGELDRSCHPGAVFLSNSSTLSLTRLGDSLPPRRRPLLAGLHFLHPVSRVPAVELVMARETGDRAVAVARELAHLLGKEVMEVAESPGYVSSRLMLSLINEAAQLVLEGVATRDVVDRTTRLRFGAGHGPLALADELGLDSVLQALESLHRETGLSRFVPSPLLRRMVNQGWLGEKSGRGFYRYDSRGRRLPDPPDVVAPTLERLLGTHGGEGGEE